MKTPNKPFNRTQRKSKRYMGDREPEHATPCEYPGCTEAGVYRAPRDRSLRDYMWLCLDHVREHNKTWNYYEGLSQTEMEQEIRRDTVWQRPTWKLGEKDAAAARAFYQQKAHIKDPFNVLSDEPGSVDGKQAPPTKAKPGSPAHAMEVLELSHPLTRQALKMRYYELVKVHHPDRHGGDKIAEEKFKTINEAYTILLRYLDADTRHTAF